MLCHCIVAEMDSVLVTKTLHDIRRELDPTVRECSKKVLKLGDQTLKKSIYTGLSPTIVQKFESHHMMRYVLRDKKFVVVSPGMEWLLYATFPFLENIIHAVNQNGDAFLINGHSFILWCETLSQELENVSWVPSPHIATVEIDVEIDKDESSKLSTETIPHKLPPSAVKAKPYFLSPIKNESYFFIRYILTQWLNLRERVHISEAQATFSDIFPLSSESSSLESYDLNPNTTLALYRSNDKKGMMLIPLDHEAVLYDWLELIQNGKSFEVSLSMSATMRSIWLIKISDSYAIVGKALWDLSPSFQKPEGPHMLMNLLEAKRMTRL